MNKHSVKSVLAPGSGQGYQSTKILEGEEGIFLLEGIFGRKEGNSFQIPSKFLEGLGRIFFGVSPLSNL